MLFSTQLVKWALIGMHQQSRMSIDAGAMDLLCHQSRLAELMPFAMFDQTPTQIGTRLKKSVSG